MFRKTCVRCMKKAKKKDLIAFSTHKGLFSGYACKGCFEVLDVMFNFTGKHPERPPE